MPSSASACGPSLQDIYICFEAEKRSSRLLRPTSQPSPPIDLLAAPTGPYFFYGTLRDPSLLAEALNLDHEPTLRPVYIMGYKTMLWGQYPALIDARGEVVEGVVYHVRTVEDAERLVEYEMGRGHRAEACLVRYIDGKWPAGIWGIRLSLWVGWF